MNIKMEQNVKLDYTRFDPAKGWPDFWLSVARWEKKSKEPQKQAILEYINEWLNLKGKNKIKSFYAFQYKYVEQLPNDKYSKDFLIRNFNKYNDLFKLDLEYDEKLFTKYNVLYMLKLMLKQLDYDLKREKTVRYKRYSIISNEKLCSL